MIKGFLVFIISTLPIALFAQTDSTENSELLRMLEKDEQNQVARHDITTATFKTTRLINGHSIENTAKGILDFKIAHRFGPVNTGIRDFFGLDGATTLLGFDYGVTNWLTVGISRSSFEKEYEGYIKTRLLRQTDDNHMPLSVSYVGAISITTIPAPALTNGQEYFLSNRLFYVNQLLIARKFSSAFSIQLTPTHVHYNLVGTLAEPNDVLAMGMGGRIKLSQRVTFNVEYFYQLDAYRLNNSVNSLSLGFDLETGGHVFQLHFTNSTGMTERTFVGQSRDRWEDGSIHFGFNIARVFTIVRPKGFENTRNKIY